ncbi:MAG: DUF805 domain-containing protein [Planctomycetaceae bacterium]|jgi:uncharacterized membrane protein YhaH (DUF805 family)|nr:DUF805 domain-containing protein [Planctomycetaceae bacterium]
MAYYIQIRNKPFGPFNTEQLNEMKDNGKLGRSTMISENKIDWITAESIDFLFPAQQQPAQQPQISPTPITPATPSILEPSEWYYSNNGVDGYGPVAVSEIVRLIKSGTLRADSVAWQDGQFAQNLNELPQFSELFNSTYGLDVGSRKQNFTGNSHAVKTDFAGTGYADVLKKYADFSGRARRREFWNFTICNLMIFPLLLISIGIITIFIMTAFDATTAMKFIVAYCLAAVFLIYNVLILLPSIAVCVRRLHDTGNSGWMILIQLIPFIGAIILIVFLVQDSQPGNNQYGENPKYIY